MTRTFAVLEKTNDLYLDDMGNLAIAIDVPENPESVLQCCAHAVKTRLGEVIYDTAQGVAFFETAFAGKPNLVQFESQIRQAIIAVPGVVSVVNITMDVIQDPEFLNDVTHNILQYTALIETEYGIGEIHG